MHPDPPPDVALLLRAHSEQRWLSREAIPVVRQIETAERLPVEQLPAAIAYLEVIWVEAVGLAREADAALCRLDEALDVPEDDEPRHSLGHQPLSARARRYHASVRTLREAVACRVALVLGAPVDYATSADRRADALV